MKKLLLSIISIFLLFSLCGCSLLYDSHGIAEDSFEVYYTSQIKEAFIHTYYWDGSEEGKTIIIPETFEGCTITTLGGNHGKGVPSPFHITFTDEAKELLRPDAFRWDFEPVDKTKKCDVEYISFNLHISQYIDEFDCVSFDSYYVARYGMVPMVYVVTFNVTCDENNKTFYAKDGKLYYRGNDALVDVIPYSDFVLETPEEG